MFRKAAFWLGLTLTIMGALGYIPSLTPHDAQSRPLLFGVLEASTGHNLIRLGWGVVALGCALNEVASKWYFRALGVVAVLAGVVGLATGHGLGSGKFVHLTAGDHVFRVILGLMCTVLGFGSRPRALR